MFISDADVDLTDTRKKVPKIVYPYQKTRQVVTIHSTCPIVDDFKVNKNRNISLKHKVTDVKRNTCTQIKIFCLSNQEYLLTLYMYICIVDVFISSISSD